VGEAIAIVGAGPGLGAAMAQRFAREGWGVGLLARDQPVIDTGRSELEGTGVAVATALADVGDEAAVDQGLRSIDDALGGLHMVVYNASIFQAEPALELSTDALMLALRIHVLGALNTAKSAVALMAPRGRGILTFTINCLALHPEAASTALSIGKGAQHNLALSLEQELVDTGIHVAVVTITKPIAVGTAFDPTSIAETYWRISQQDPDRFQRDHVFDG
jgi:NAD(P)-dependent dehydrogenase (short-subunit alcohol dehydrogenase family)